MHILSELLVSINNLYSLIFCLEGKKKASIYTIDVKSKHKKEIYANILKVVYSG